jgi:hypothetical protein
MDRWRELAPYPVPMSMVSLFRGLHMAVHEDKAYLFTGRPSVDYFDLDGAVLRLDLNEPMGGLARLDPGCTQEIH